MYICMYSLFVKEINNVCLIYKRVNPVIYFNTMYIFIICMYLPFLILSVQILFKY